MENALKRRFQPTPFSFSLRCLSFLEKTKLMYDAIQIPESMTFIKVTHFKASDGIPNNIRKEIKLFKNRSRSGT